jgi:hypothetical protein
MTKITLLLIFLLIVFFSFIISSMPRFSVKLGNKCIDCHYNPTGGIIRNLDGWNWGKNTLSMLSTPDKEFLMSPKLNDNISIGMDYRTQFLYSQEKKRSDFQQMTGSMYANLAIAKNINILGKYDFVTMIWEGYAVANILPNNSYIKAGSFTPNFGIRIDDHTAYTRGGDEGLLYSKGVYQGLIYNPHYTEAGVEVGFYGSNFLFATASAGANLISNRTLSKDPTYTARLELTPRIDNIGLMLGGSYAAAKIPGSIEMYGGFLGFGYDEFSLLSEYDIANDLTGENIKSNVLMVEAAYGIITGLDAVVRYDWLDPNNDVSSDEVSHLVIGFEFQPYTFIEIRPQYRFVMENPRVNNDAFVLQFHFWY